MKTSLFLQHLKEKGIKVWAEDGSLKISAAKGALTPELRDELVGRKAEILAALQSALVSSSAGDQDSRPPITRVSREEPLPLSFSQRRLWFMQQLEPEMFAYNLPLAWHLRGKLDVDLLEEVLNQLIARHEALHTSFTEKEGVPVQAPLSSIPRQNLRVIENEDKLSLEDWWLEVARQMTAAGEVAFDLTQAPLVRLMLFRIQEDEHILLVPVHHIVIDGISIAVFAQEMSALYEALSSGAPSPLPEMQVQYADYAVWQERIFEAGEFDQQLAFWMKNLAGDLPIMDLPADRPRPPVQTFNGGKEYLEVPNELYRRLEDLAKREGVTFYMAFLAAYKLLLCRYSGLEDIIVGTAVDGRPRPEVESVVGIFVNTIALRTDLSGDPTFRELMLRVRDTCLEAFENKELPFERLVDELQPERNLSYTPIFQAQFFHELTPPPPEDTGDLIFANAGPLDGWEFRQAKNDLSLWISHEPRKMWCWAEYNADLFGPERIQTLLESYRIILETIAADVSMPISSIPLIADADRERILVEWNDTDAPYSEQPIHVQFEEQVRRTPDATALIFPAAEFDAPIADITYSYLELDEAANRLARHLIQLGVAPRSLVGLALERSAEMVIAQLAIQKAGCAYVPLDPSYPSDRLAYMVEDAALAFVVTTQELSGFLTDDVRRVCLDSDAAKIAQCAADSPGVPTASDDRIYVIYTSGSTGRPKGVELEHRSVSNFLASMAREPGFGAGDRMLAVTTLSFDISVLETMLPLVVGGTLIVAPREATTDGEHLIALMQRLSPTVMQATPATWRLLILSDWEGDENLRLLIGGEALPRELASELLPLSGELWNMYGPTESTIWSTIKHIRPEDEVITIGRPIAGTEVYVLGPDRLPVPLGVTGELWIAGAGLARGYLERPELTSERFPAHPFRSGDSEHAVQRIYRTGDEARWTLDGELECLGRIDSQVKLRGYRIELGEIEAVLAEVDGVAACVCIIREDTPGDQRLTAYFTEGGLGELASGAGTNGVGTSAQRVDQDLLREAAHAKLPSYMVPAAFHALSALPQTPNGKVDRKALLARSADSAPAAETQHRMPEGERQRELAGYWSEILKVESVPADRNFFDLGGHSLLLAQVHAKLRRAHPELKLSIIELFQFPTIEALVAHMEKKASGKSPARKEEPSRNLASGRRALMRRRRGR